MLTTDPNIAAPDEFYEMLLDAHQGLSEAQSHSLNGRLILLMANHIGDLGVLREALAAASGSGRDVVQQPHPAKPRGGDQA